MSSHPHDCPDPISAGVDYFRQLCQHTGVGLIATNKALEICFWNPAAARIFGASSQLMIGQHITSIVPSERRGLATHRLRQALERKQITEFEIRHRDAQGLPRFLAVTVSPVLDEMGKAIGASTLIRDITGRVELEEKLARSRRLASLGTLAGGIAHHFNNILGGIATSVDYALDSDHPATARRALRVTADAVARASRLVDNLLSFAEGDQDDTDLADVTETVCYFLDKIEEELRRDSIDLELQSDTTRTVSVPFHRMLTILNNLIANAREAMPRGGKIKVALRHKPGRIVLHVQDTGVGIAEEDRHHIFEPFFSTKQDDRQGSPRAGLGLAVVHGIVTDWGGAIHVHSQPGRGTRIEVVIPDPLNSQARHEK